MNTQFLHGIQVQEIESGTRVIKTTKSSVIGIIGTAPKASVADFPLNTPVIVATKKAAEKLGNEGTLLDSINGIFNQIGAIVVVRVGSGVEYEEDVIDGLEAFLAAESTCFVKPKILIAPGFSSTKDVLTEMIVVAEKLKAIVVADNKNTTDVESVAYAKEFGSSRVYMVDPWVKVGDKTLPPSPYVAGLIAKSDNENGFWRSPSNQEILGITGIARPIDFSFGDSSCSSNFLNENNVATIIHQNGYRLWGNRSTSSDSKWSFLSVRRTADMINESLLKAHLWAIDRNITRTYISDVCESVNAYLASLKSQGAILGGVCYAASAYETNTKENILDGKIVFDFEFTPPYPAEHIVFRSYLTDDYIKEVI